MSIDIAVRLKQVYSAGSNQQLEEAYNQWASMFDQDSELRGGRQPALVSSLMMRYVDCNQEGAILDAGVGTGLMGEFLQPFGYQELVGIDFSEAMLKIAAEKNIYTDLKRMTLGEPLDFPDNTFQATISAGVFTQGHAPASCLDELIRVTKTGGYLIFSVNNKVFPHEFEPKQQALEKSGQWKLIEMTEPCAIMPKLEPDTKARLCIYKVC